MSQAVETILHVIEGMNLSDSDRLLLIEKLNKTANKNTKPKLKPLTERQMYCKKFERWLVERKRLYPPKDSYL